MQPHDLRQRLEPLRQSISEQLGDWTLVACLQPPIHQTMAVLALDPLQFTASTTAELLALALPQQGRLLVLCDDLDPDGGAIELIQQLRQRHGAHRCRFLVCLHSTIHQERLERIWRCGVDGLSCLDHCGNGHILQTLLILMRGLTCMDPLFTERLRRQGAEALEHQLEERDLQLIQALARGRSCREIAALWQLRYDSVRRLLSSLYHRVGVRNQRELLTWSLEQGLVTLPVRCHRQSAAPAAPPPDAAAGSWLLNPAAGH